MKHVVESGDFFFFLMCFEWYNERGDLQSYLGESKTEDEFVVVVASGVLWLRSIYFFLCVFFPFLSRDIKIYIYLRARANFKAELTGDDVSRIERGLLVSTTFALPLLVFCEGARRGVRAELCERRKGVFDVCVVVF